MSSSGLNTSLEMLTAGFLAGEDQAFPATRQLLKWISVGTKAENETHTSLIRADAAVPPGCQMIFEYLIAHVRSDTELHTRSIAL